MDVAADERSRPARAAMSSTDVWRADVWPSCGRRCPAPMCDNVATRTHPAALDFRLRRGADTA
jgi:hypothetical protein